MGWVGLVETKTLVHSIYVRDFGRRLVRRLGLAFYEHCKQLIEDEKMRRKEKLGGGERENESERVGEIESERRSSSSRILKRKKNCSNNKILFVCLERKRGKERERVRVCVKEGM